MLITVRDEERSDEVRDEQAVAPSHVDDTVVLLLLRHQEHQVIKEEGGTECKHPGVDLIEA